MFPPLLACRVVVAEGGEDPCSHLYRATPFPVRRVVVAEGGEDVTIKVSDEGGGIPRSGMPRIWTYLYSTAKHTVRAGEEGEKGAKEVLRIMGFPR